MREYDLSGARTRLWWPDGNRVDYERRIDGALAYVRENGAASGPGRLALLNYDNEGHVRRIDHGNATIMTNSVTADGRLSSLAKNLGGSAYDVNWSGRPFTPARQVAAETLGNDLYAWIGRARAPAPP